MLDVQRLRVLRSVVASGSVSAAATRLGFTPSAVSQQISALQRETGLTLFEKSGRSIVPTVEGRELASRSDEVMAAMASLEKVVEDLREGRSGGLRIGTFASVGEHWLPQVARTLRHEFPGTPLAIELTDPRRSPDLPDVDIRTEDPGARAETPDGFARVVLTTEPYVLLVHEDHRFADREAVSAIDLADETWVRDDAAESTCSRILSSAWRSAGFTPRSVVQAADHHGAAAFVAAEVGVCVMPRLAAAEVPSVVRRLRITDPTPHRLVTAYVHHSVRSHPAVQRLLELLQDAATTDEGATVPRAAS